MLSAIVLNDAHRRAVLFGLLDVHRRLAEMESLLAQGQNTSPLSQYVNDLSPTEAKVVRDYFDRLRARMAACLQEAGIAPDARRTGLRWSLQVNLTALHVAIAELNPKRLRGYGPLSETGASIAVKAREDVERLIVRVEAYLRQGLGHDLPQRLARLEASDAGAATLTVVDRVITRRGLVEYRPLLDALVSRLEAPRFEVAVFGRVSSGKSSLLNHLAGADVLPVGVTPVTAVPTRLVRGEQPAAVVSFAELPPHTVPVEELHAYASEEGNRGNHKHVTGILVQFPSPRLREGVVLVDTPGIGSLALSGSAETFAYLPRCDLGIVLVDAASTLTPDDLGLLRLLSESAVPAQVVLSKADLLTPPDRQRAVDYIRDQLRREPERDLAVHPVSTVGADEALLTQWFEKEIEPMLARHRVLATASLRRKVDHLRTALKATLQTFLAWRRGGQEQQGSVDVAAIRRLLEEADQAIRQARQRCLDWTADVPGLLERLLGDAARALVASDGTGSPILTATQRALAERDQMAHGLAADLRQTLVLTLEGLRQTAPDTRGEEVALRDLVFRGLPVPDLAPLAAWSLAPPWWTGLLPVLATRATRRRLGHRLGPALRELVDVHDRQLQTWLRATVGQVADLFETQAEMFRERVRRLATRVDDGPAEDLRQLEEDLRELEATADRSDKS